MLNLSLKAITSKTEWENYLQTRSEANFLQSFNYLTFQENLGKKVFRFFIYQKNKIIGACACVKETAKRGNYLSIAGGPLVDFDQTNSDVILKFLFTSLQLLAKSEHCLFIRFRPQVIASEANLLLLKKLACIKAPMHLTADLTLQLDLTQSEPDLLRQMRKNTRYEIKRAEKLGIEVIFSKDSNDLKIFNKDQQYLAAKHGFVPFSYQFLLEQFKAFLKDDQVLLVHSFNQKKRLASAFIIFYHGEAVYHYGTSTVANERLPGSYACQWAAIKEAKRRGLKKYNFWGIAPKEVKNHRYSGVTTFKTGFRGEEINYLPAHDLACNFAYYFVYFFEILRKKLRRL